MTSFSKMKSYVSIVVAFSLVTGLLGCGSDLGTATTEKKADAATIAKTQPGANGSKAARGGGVDNDPMMPAKPGEKTGIPEAGGKSGGK